MVQRSPLAASRMPSAAVVGALQAVPAVPAAGLLAERVAAVRLPPVVPGRVRRRPHPGLGGDVVCVVTDTGIAAVLARLRAGDVPARLFWAARSPRAVFGDALVDELLATPGRPTVWDTARFGEPDLLRLAYAAYASVGATGVVCVADRRRARAVVRALTERGVPAHAGLGRTLESRWRVAAGSRMSGRNALQLDR